mgnify:CR=1 FL=1
MSPIILLFLCKKLCFNICNRNVREVGGALLVHVPVERIHHARHAGADGAVPVNAGGIGADVLRQRFAAERASAVAQADQRMDGQIKRTVHSYPSFTSS